MNIALDLIVAAIVIANVISSCAKGFFKTLISLACLVNTVVVIYLYAQPFGALINEKVVSPAIANSVMEQAEVNGEDSAENMEDEALSSSTILEKLFEGEQLIISASDKAGATVKEFTVDIIMGSALLANICSCIAAVIIAVVIKLAAWLIDVIVEPLLKLPLLKEANKGLGVVVGLVNGALLVCILCVLVNLFSAGYKPKDGGSFKSEVVEKTYVYKYVDEYNPINKIFQ